jgi:hypothetical protein
MDEMSPPPVPVTVRGEPRRVWTREQKCDVAVAPFAFHSWPLMGMNETSVCETWPVTQG